ncbi:hypothetical protein TSAR_000940, partial [Trichomalopsis sarcophagae]
MEIVVDTVDLENDPGVRIRIEKAFVPKNYVQAGDFNDIGILKLKSGQKLILPKAGENFDDQIATIAGFGWTDSNDYSTIGKHLKYWTSKVISKNDCLNYWRNVVSKDYLCSQMLLLPNAAKVGVCNGDSGSPLVINDTVIGVTVIAEWNCDERVKPALYTKVSIHLPFIETVMTGQHNNVAQYDFPSPCIAAHLDGEGIIGGEEASPNQFPYLVSVYHTNSRHNCMGGILNDRYILTAAHCI